MKDIGIMPKAVNSRKGLATLVLASLAIGVVAFALAGGKASAAPADGFRRPVVSLTFDDGWKSIHTNALPVLKQNGFPSTQYINSQPIADGFEGYMSYQDVADFASSGSEIAWHTRTHADLVQADAVTRDLELTVPINFAQALMNLNVGISKNFATPLGSYNDSVIAAIKTHGYTSHRSTDQGFNMRVNVDDTHVRLTPDNIRVQNMLNTTTAEQVQGWLNDAKANNAYLVLVYHEVSDNPVDPDPTYSVTTSNFASQMAAVKQSGVAVMTVQSALAELEPQL